MKLRYLGISLGSSNVPKLIGENIEDENLKEIVKIIKANEYISEVHNEKGLMLGS